jgi:hypothetical protein
LSDTRSRAHHAGQQIIKGVRLLQVAQPQCVGRGYIHREIARDRSEHLDQAHIVGAPVGGVAIGADVHPDNAAAVGPGDEAGEHGFAARTVEPEPIDDRFVSIEAKQARARVARLRAQGDGADFGKAEAKAQERVRHVGTLVEPGRDADRIAKVQSERPHRKSRIIARLSDPRG